jgi:hypothetical protein
MAAFGSWRRTAGAQLTVALLVATIRPHAPIAAQAGSQHASDVPGTAVLWREPTDIASRDLVDGPGGRAHTPYGTTFRFIKEDLDGSNPKFIVEDDAGTKWKVKLGWEAQPETVAARIVWAVGYVADDDYYLPRLCVEGVPATLHRGHRLIDANGCINGGRLKREKDDAAATSVWRWRTNPFTGTRELNGLRTLMAVINNWDLKDVNNHVRTATDAEGHTIQVYWVSDLGASFGTTRLGPGHRRTRGNLDAYRQSSFILNTTACCVDFAVPGRAAPIVLVNPMEYSMRSGLRWIGRQIPRSDARWMGMLLTRLSQNQIRDAFRAAGYSEDDAGAFTAALEQRIAALRAL